MDHHSTRDQPLVGTLPIVKVGSLATSWIFAARFRSDAAKLLFLAVTIAITGVCCHDGAGGDAVDGGGGAAAADDDDDDDAGDGDGDDSDTSDYNGGNGDNADGDDGDTSPDYNGGTSLHLQLCPSCHWQALSGHLHHHLHDDDDNDDHLHHHLLSVGDINTQNMQKLLLLQRMIKSLPLLFDKVSHHYFSPSKTNALTNRNASDNGAGCILHRGRVADRFPHWAREVETLHNGFSRDHRSFHCFSFHFHQSGTVFFLSFSGAGFLAATFLVRPFLPNSEETSPDQICGRFLSSAAIFTKTIGEPLHQQWFLDH